MGLFKKDKSKVGLAGQPLNMQQQDFSYQREAGISRTLREFWVWYTGNAEKLIKFYKNMQGVDGKQDYFWCVTAYENNKKTHTGLPKAIIDAITNTTGIPNVTIEGKELQKRLDDIITFNDGANLIKQDMRPKTCVIGGGVLFVSNLKPINERLDKPLIEFIDERYCDIEMIGNVFISATKKSVYFHNGDKYTLLEKRSFEKIEYKLYNESKKKTALLTEIPETQGLEPVIDIPINMVPAIPVRYKNGTGRTYGLSMYEGKLDLMDDYDQTASQIAELIKQSSAVTYMPSDLVETDKRNNKAILPNRYDKRYIEIKNGKKQESKEEIKIDQPQLNYRDMVDAGINQLIQILTGLLAPATLGIEVQRNNNAEAMREKEKVTLVTRDDIIDNEIEIIKRLYELSMKMYDYMEGTTIGEYDIHVGYPEFSTPTFDAIVATLLPLWSAGAISPQEFIARLYGEDLTDDEKKQEVEYLENNKTVTNFDFFPDTQPLDNRTDGSTQTEVDNVQQ